VDAFLELQPAPADTKIVAPELPGVVCGICLFPPRHLDLQQRKASAIIDANRLWLLRMRTPVTPNIDRLAAAAEISPDEQDSVLRSPAGRQ